MQMTTDGAQSAFYELAGDAQLDWIPPTSEWIAENSDARIAIMAEVNTRELSAGRPEEAGPRPAGAPAAHGDHDAAIRRGRAPLGADALPQPRVRERGGDVAERVRGLLLRGLPRRRRRPGDRVGAPGRRGQAAGRLDRGQAGGPHHGPRHRHHPRRGGPPWIPCYGEHNMPDGEFFTGPIEDSVNGEVSLLVPGQLRRAHRVRRADALRGRQGRGRLGRAGRGLPDRDARHRRGRPPPGRARHRHQLRHLDRHQGDPARREDRRDDPHGDRDELPRERRHQQLRGPLGHGLRPAPRAARWWSTGWSCSATAASWSEARPARRAGHAAELQR